MISHSFRLTTFTSINIKKEVTEMVELSLERIDQIMHGETPKTEESPTILRGIYTRYMRLYENYFADIDALNDDKIAEFRKYSEETRSLLKYYYMDIPLDVCTELLEFDNEYSKNLLGADWHKFLFESYGHYKSLYKEKRKSEECLKAEFTEQILEAFYEAMDNIFREAFGTGSKQAEQVTKGLAGLLFGE